MFSALTGIGFFGAFTAISSGASSSAVMLVFYAAVALIWVWHFSLMTNLLESAGASHPGPVSPS